MRKLIKGSRCIILPTLLTCLLLFLCTYAADSTEIAMVPVNPAFTDFTLYGPQLRGAYTESEAKGYIPSPVNRSHLRETESTSFLRLEASLPSSYDLRQLGKVTPVRNQGSCGACWAFGTIASLESALLPGETRDFSENNLKNNHGFDWEPCAGGNTDISTAYLIRWSGPVDETDDPYRADSAPSPAGLSVRKHVMNIIHLPTRTSSTSNDVIKNALMNYGAVTVSYYDNSAYYNATNKAYYYSGATNANHEVAIVGWDDNFDRNKFSPSAPGNGAFIIKNSWGTSWGDNGYFNISYYDSKLGYGDLAAFTAPPGTDNYSRLYSYDPLGNLGNIGYTGNNTAWFSNIFTAQGNDRIAAVSFYNSTLNSSYTIYIYNNLTSAVNPTSGTLISTTNGTLADAGYLTIPLETAATLSTGQVFSVVVKLTTPNYNYPVPIEQSFIGYSSGASAQPGQSYISSNGSTWTDTTTINSTMNVCVKAYAVNAIHPPSDISIFAVPASPRVVGTPVILTANASGGLGPYEYQFWLKDTSGVYTLVQPFSASPTWNWTTSGLPAGTYSLAVQAKSAESISANGFDVEKVINYVIQ